MPSGITHILLARNFQDQLPIGKLRKILSASRHFFQVGAVGPDLPYASGFDEDLFFSDQSELADKMHYTTTNQIPLLALPHIKTISQYNQMRKKEKRYKFAFFLGYISHIVADGLIHPYVRDKVGEYAANKTDHRILEMRMDVLLYHHFNKATGASGELNYSNLHDELRNLEGYTQTNSVMQLFKECIGDAYGDNYDMNTVKGWVIGLHRLFAVAEGEHPAIYSNLSILDGALYKNYDDLEEKAEEILLLTKPKDRDENFLKTDQVHIINDCIPKFNEVFMTLAIKSYEYIYKNGPALTENDLPNIDLDTGRPADRSQELDLIPTLWS